MRINWFAYVRSIPAHRLSRRSLTVTRVHTYRYLAPGNACFVILLYVRQKTPQNGTASHRSARYGTARRCVALRCAALLSYNACAELSCWDSMFYYSTVNVLPVTGMIFENFLACTKV